MSQKPSRKNLWGATLLVAGTCIGGGMLALPVETGMAGLIPSLLVMLVSCVFMAFTGLLIVEANLWMEEGAHMTSMAARFLGPAGKFLSMGLYLFMGYASLVAYTAGGGVLINNALGVVGEGLSRESSCLVFSLLFGTVVCWGTKRLGYVNALLVGGMVAAYVGLVATGVTQLKPTLLERKAWAQAFLGTPLILTTFSYQMVVPSLTPYLNRDPQALRKAILWGTAIPFIVYGIWQLIILGSVPLEGEYGLKDALIKGQAATESLRAFVRNPWIAVCAEMFAFFALVTSYLGIALGLFDFLADAFKVSKKGMGKVLLTSFVVLPSLFFAVIYPRAFLLSLEVTGGFGDSILNGLLPVLMVWIGRYRQRLSSSYSLEGGKTMLGSLFTFAMLVLVLQVVKLF